MDTPETKIAVLDNRVTALESNKSEMWDQLNEYKAKVPSMIKTEVSDARTDIESNTNLKIQNSMNMVVLKIVGSLSVILVVLEIVKRFLPS